MKQLIAIIIVSFDNNKQFGYNKNRQNIMKIGRNNETIITIIFVIIINKNNCD